MKGEFRGGFRVTTPEVDGRRADGAVRSGRPRARRPDQRARPVRGRHLRRGRAPVHRDPAHRRSSRASRPTSASSATSPRSTPTRCSISLRPDGSRWCRRSRPTRTAWCTTSMPTPRPRRSPRRSVRRSWWCSPTSRGCTRIGRTATRSSSEIDTAALAELLPSLDAGHGAQDGGLPARGARRRAAGARHRRPGAAFRSARTVHRRGHRHDGDAREADISRAGSRLMTATTELQQRWSAALMNTYGVPRVALVRGEGAVSDRRRRQAVRRFARRHCRQHSRPCASGDHRGRDDQLSTLGHVSNLYASEPVVALAEQLLAHICGDVPGRVFFCNSGTEANEAAFKLARGHRTDEDRRRREGASMAGRWVRSALTGQPAKRAPFEPMPAGVEHVPYGDVEALDRAVDDDTAAVFLEPIMGEGGVVVPPEGYLVEARRDHRATRRAAGARRGADRHRPDRLVLRAPGRRHRAGRHHPRQGSRRRHADRRLHRAPALRQNCSDRENTGRTFGGNPVCAAAALAVLRAIADEDLISRADALGKAIAARHRGTRAIRWSTTCAVRVCCSASC